MNTKRLLALADLLDTVPRAHFHPGPLFSGYTVPTLSQLKSEKGLTACAMGWAALHPPFRRMGLGTMNYGFVGTLSYNGSANIHAVTRFFEIDYDTSKSLFSDDGYANPDKTTPKMVARKIRKFVTKGSL